MRCSGSFKSVPYNRSIEPTPTQSGAGGHYKRTVTRISSSVQPTISSVSTSSSVSSAVTDTFVNTGSSTVQCAALRNCLHLYKNARTCQEYVAVEVMENGETLCQYATRFLEHFVTRFLAYILIPAVN